jgi:hypothetical protein
MALRWIVSLTVILVASAIIWLGMPRLVASALKAPAQASLVRIQAGKTPTSSELERAVAHLKRAHVWEASAQLRSEIGFLRLLDAFQLDPSDETRSAKARLAAEFFTESLYLSPARPHPWVRLAYARELEGSTGAELSRLLQQSVAVGPFVGEIALVRLNLLLKHWGSLSPDLRLYTFSQIRYMWASDRSFVLEAGKRTSKPHIIRFALRTVPGAIDQFDRVNPPPSN